VLLVLAGVPFARRYVDEPRRAERRTARLTRVPVAALAVLTVAMAVVGAVFGAVQVGVVGYARQTVILRSWPRQRRCSVSPLLGGTWRG
jgi:hypothetical protein